MRWTPATQPMWEDAYAQVPPAPPRAPQRSLKPSGWLAKASYLVQALLRRPTVVRDLSSVLLVVSIASLAALIWPASTDAYALSITQVRLVEEIKTNPDLFARYREQSLIAGDPVTTIRIPSIDLEYVVVQGIGQSDLQSGAGHYPQTPLPGQAGNVAIAGHRTTWGRPFNRLDELVSGDHIELSTPLGTYTYAVTQDPALQLNTMIGSCKPGHACWITSPYAWDVVKPTSEANLTLTTCHPKGSARERLIVRAHLVESKDMDGKPLPLPAPIPADQLPVWRPEDMVIPGE